MSGNQHPSVTDAPVETSAACPSGQAPVFKPVKGERSLLLHICCGPCSIMPVKRLQDEGFTVTAWYMNPNIQPLMEYLRRREAAEECAARLGIELICQDDTCPRSAAPGVAAAACRPPWPMPAPTAMPM